MKQDRQASQEIEQSLREALAHLYDPAYEPPDTVWTLTGCDRDQGRDALRAALRRSIEDLRPPPGTPTDARITRVYELLSFRYIQHLTQEEAAERLGISPRHLRREQSEAVRVLAMLLRERSDRSTPQGSGTPERSQVPLPGAASLAPSQPTEGGRPQIREELASLRESAPGALADLGEAIAAALDLAKIVASSHGVSLQVETTEAGTLVSIHPSALRQILIKTVSELVKQMPPGSITIGVERQTRRARVSLLACPLASAAPLDSEFIEEIVAAHGGTVTIAPENGCLAVSFDLPTMDMATVLVVDDNQDLVHFFRRYTNGTRYRIVHLREGRHLFDAIRSSPPDAIVLDVMLPDCDGWELLSHLHTHPETASIPVIICSVVRQEDLALALGASLYLPKPVRRRQLIEALDTVLTPG